MLTIRSSSRVLVNYRTRRFDIAFIINRPATSALRCRVGLYSQSVEPVDVAAQHAICIRFIVGLRTALQR